MRPRIEEYHSQVARLFPDPNDRTVRNVTVQLTDACNLRCTYCYQIAKKNHFIPAELAIKYIKHILTGDNPYINFENSNGMVLEFIGGEPLLAIDTMSEIVEWVFDYMIKNNHPWLHRTRLSVCSNGTLYFEPKVQKFLERWHNVTSFSISIDGNKRLHDSCRLFPDGRGSYDIAAAAAKDFIKRYPYHFTGTKLTFSPDNVSYAFEALKNLYEEFGYTCIHANCCYEEGWELKHATILYHELVKLTDWLEENNLLDSIYYSLFEDSHFKPMEPGDDDNWCGGNGSMIACDWKGDIYPCIRYMESSLGNDAPPVIIGTVDGGIEATCEQKHCVECLKAVDRRTQSTDECYNCPIAGGCSWCSGYNYQLFGTANKRATFICVMHKARALANSYFWAKYRKHHPKEPCVYEHHVPDEWALEIIGEDELNKLKAVMAE